MKTFVWAEHDFSELHAVQENQLTTDQAAHCECSPYQGLHWHLAEGSFLKLPRCRECVKLTQGYRDTTEQVARKAQKKHMKELQAETKVGHGKK
jgi:hypothetical protein